LGRFSAKNHVPPGKTNDRKYTMSLTSTSLQKSNPFTASQLYTKILSHYAHKFPKVSPAYIECRNPTSRSGRSRSNGSVQTCGAWRFRKLRIGFGANLNTGAHFGMYRPDPLRCNRKTPPHPLLLLVRHHTNLNARGDRWILHEKHIFEK
jgi:hypothetical protein